MKYMFCCQAFLIVGSPNWWCEKFNEFAGDKDNVQCFLMHGDSFKYLQGNVYIPDVAAKTFTKAVGFLHWVIIVDKDNEKYILDPTITQFLVPPSYLVVRSVYDNKMDLFR